MSRNLQQASLQAACRAVLEWIGHANAPSIFADVDHVHALKYMSNVGQESIVYPHSQS